MVEYRSGRTKIFRMVNWIGFALTGSWQATHRILLCELALYASVLSSWTMWHGPSQNHTTQVSVRALDQKMTTTMMATTAQMM